MRSPFKFLDSYSLQDKDTFFGRKKETDLFYEMVNKNRLLLVYGQSGSGKTSLVECGLANRFDVTDWYPIRVRRRQNLNESLRESLQAILIADEVDEDYDLPETLTEQIEDIYAEYLRPVYLIFDQLEEVFILGNEAEQYHFIQSIEELYTSKIACRIIFILREEYLGHLYDFEKVIPTLFDRRLRVEVMNNTKVQSVLEKSFAKFNIHLEAPAEDRLREMIANMSGGKALIQLPYLQVYLDMLYREDYQRTYGDKERGDELPPLEFTQAEIAEYGEIEEVLSKFLNFQEKEIQGILSAQYPDLLEHTVLQIMDALVTDEGTKRPLAYTRVEGLVVVDEKVRRLFPPVSDEVLSDCFLELEKARIIRGSDNFMELAHDSLAALLTKKRGTEQQLRKRLSAALQEYELSGGKQLLTETQLLGMTEMLPKLYLDEVTHDFIEKSKQVVAEEKERAEAATERELAEQRARAAEERQLRETAEKAQDVAEANSEKAKLLTRLAALFSILAITTAVLAFWQYQDAQTKKVQAIVALAKLQEANTKRVERFLKEVDNHILQIQYETAFEKVQVAYEIGINLTESKKRLQEIAYYYTESEQLNQADSVLQLIDIFVSNKQKENFREKIETIDTTHFQILENRYFPEMVLVPSGIFDMGIDSIENNGFPEQSPKHKVKLDSFRIAKSETTVWQYLIYARANKRTLPEEPAWGWNGHDAMVRVNWFQAIAYMNWLSEVKGYKKVYSFESKNYHLEDTILLTLNWEEIPNWQADGYRLPTEAEWEYAAKGGPDQRGNFQYAGSDSLNLVGWFFRNSNLRVHQVASLKPNSLGLYDMSGNVWEYVWDSYDGEYYQEFENNMAFNPTGPPSNETRVLKGGSWNNNQIIVTCTYRGEGSHILVKYSNYGFRCVRRGQ